MSGRSTTTPGSLLEPAPAFAFDDLAVMPSSLAYWVGDAGALDSILLGWTDTTLKREEGGTRDVSSAGMAK